MTESTTPESAVGADDAAAPSRTPWFFYGTATGVVLATAIALAGFIFVRGQDSARLNEVKADLQDMKVRGQNWADNATFWKQKYEAADGGDVSRMVAFTKAWKAATIPLRRRYVILAFRPGPATTNAYLHEWRTRYSSERSTWWAEIEVYFQQPGTPEEDPQPNPDISHAFLNLGVWSLSAGEHRDAQDALKVALLWAPPEARDVIRHAMGQHRYSIPEEIATTASTEHLTNLKQFEGAWVTDANRHLIERFEAEARGNR